MHAALISIVFKDYMKNLIITIIVFLSIRNCAEAQPAFKQRFGTNEDYKRLWYLNFQYIQAWVHSDTGIYNRLLWAEDFVHQSGANGHLYPKKEIMKIFGHPRFDQIRWFYPDNTRIQFVNNEVAMVLSRPPYFGKGDSAESFSQYNDVYVKRNGEWICVSANITNIVPLNTPLPVLSKLPQETQFPFIHKGREQEGEAIIKLHKQVRSTLENADYKNAGTILDEDFSLLTVNGRLQSKSSLINQFKKQGKVRPPTYQLINLALRFVSTNVAMVHGAMIVDSKDRYQRGIQFNDIFVKRESGWRLVSSNNTPIKN